LPVFPSAFKVNHRNPVLGRNGIAAPGACGFHPVIELTDPDDLQSQMMDGIPPLPRGS